MKLITSNNQIINYLRILFIITLLIVLFSGVFLSRSILEKYKFAEREIKGIEIIHDLSPIVLEIQKYRGLEQSLLYGKTKPDSGNNQKVDELRENTISAINKFLAKNKKDDFKINEKLKIISEQLDNHKNKDFKSAIEHFFYHTKQIETVLEMIQKTHHMSNLALDPEYDSYYLQSIGVMRMSSIIENLGKIRGLAIAYSQQTIMNDEIHHFLEQELVLLKNNKKEIDQRITYLLENSPEIGNLFLISRENLLKQIDQFHFYINRILKTPQIKISSEDLFSQGTAVIDQASDFQFHILEKIRQIIVKRSEIVIAKSIVFVSVMLVTLAMLLWAMRLLLLQNKRSVQLLQAITNGRQQLIYAGNPVEIYMNLCKILVDYCGYIVAGVFLIKNNLAKELEPVAIYGSASGYLEDLRVSWGDNELGQGPFGRAIRTGRPQIFNNVLNQPGFKPWAERARQYNINSSASIPLMLQGDKIGVIGLYSNNKKAFQVDEIEMISNLMEDAMFNIAAMETRKERDMALEKLSSHNSILKKSVLEKTKRILETQDATIFSLASLVESRDNETGNHILRTREYVRLLLNDLKEHPDLEAELLPEKVDHIYKTSPLHDIGKIAIPDAILRKPGKLTKKEYEAMKKHTVIGATAIKKAAYGISSSEFLETAREIILHHHEKWDGSGYPIGLKGNQIPIAARIMSVADVYDALITERVYKKAFTHSEASLIIENGAGIHFDPIVVKTFLELGDAFQEIAQQYKD